MCSMLIFTAADVSVFLSSADTDVVNDEVKELPEERSYAGCSYVSEVCFP